MMRGNREFVLLDDQKLAYETAIKLASGIAAGKKQTLVINGGPGTGKSVLAINMLVEFISQGFRNSLLFPRMLRRELSTSKTYRFYSDPKSNINLSKGSALTMIAHLAQ